ncbi:unnamed protein product [Kluyveromyces dobzhanskii CBS 2104]|uniref:WGS project CCBQ000000000 data, contig 00058 n=1 Tax=Kluyveromyces dobzhanskii CBS 2104 TaxID=1427455 RepID=A0A0A8LD67_9SACH|nr:unnamed protein product [Kluyveromyces dobzhanskii CBS 2104]
MRKVHHKPQSRFKPGSSNTSFNNRANPSINARKKQAAPRISTLNNKTNTANKTAIPSDMYNLEREAAGYLTQLAQLGYSFDEILKGARSNRTFLSDMYDTLQLPANISPKDDPVKETSTMKGSKDNCYVAKQETTHPSENTVRTSVTTRDESRSPIITQNDNTSPLSGQEPTTIDLIASETNEEKLGIALYEQISRILMKSRLDLLKLKAASNKKVPKFTKELEISLKKKKDLLISDVDNFYSSIGLLDEFAPGRNDDFIELEDSVLEDDRPANIPNKANVLPKNLQTSQPTYENGNLRSSNPLLAHTIHDVNENVQPSTIIEDSVIKLKRSTPDHFTPYQSLNLTKSTQPNN